MPACPHWGAEAELTPVVAETPAQRGENQAGQDGFQTWLPCPGLKKAPEKGKAAGRLLPETETPDQRGAMVLVDSLNQESSKHSPSWGEDLALGGGQQVDPKGGDGLLAYAEP